MSKRKGLSLEEKRTKMCELFFEKKDVFLLKELEKIAPKEKGIVSQSVKDVVQSLVDDNMIDTDKIGTSTYYWSFPSQAHNARANKLQELNEQAANQSKKLKTLDEQLKKVDCGKENDVKREKGMVELKQLQSECDELRKKVDKLSGFDPVVIEKMKNEVKIGKEAINRWTDNVFSIKSWCRDKMNVDENNINKQFQIPEELDYVDV